MGRMGVDTSRDEVYTRLWYRLRREGIGLPYPHRTIHTAPTARPEEFPADHCLELLRTVDLFASLDDARLRSLSSEVKVLRFGRSERVIQEGANGQTFYIVAEGEVFGAQCLLHETDHLSGVLYVDRLRTRDDLHAVETDEEDSERQTA